VVQLQAHEPHVPRHSVFSYPRNIQEKSSNLKFLEKRARLHLSHWIAYTGWSAFAQEQWILPFLCTTLFYLFYDQIRGFRCC